MQHDQFATLRRSLEPVDLIDPPDPVGWNPDGTVTGNPKRLPPGADPWDSRPARNPYPSQTPGLAFDPTATRHVQLIRHFERRTFEESLLLAGGEDALPETHRRGEAWRRNELRQAILRRKAILEELGTGVVLLTPEELAFLEEGDEGVPA